VKHKFVIGVLLTALMLPPSVSAAVVINEIFPKTADPAQSWVELYNSGGDSVSLNQWKLGELSNNQSFILNASWIITPNGFLLLPQTQTAITPAITGDTFTLTDDHGTVVDRESYPGTLGFNTSMGRSPDGANSWTVCDTATPGKTNDCPPATPTPTLSPTPIPTNTPTPVPTDTPTPTEETVSGMPMFHPLAIVATPSLTPTPSNILVTIHVPSAISITKSMAVQIVVVAFSWMLLAAIALSRKKRPPRHET